MPGALSALADGAPSGRVTGVDARVRLLGLAVALLALSAAAPIESVAYRRRTRDARVDYPLVTLCLARTGDGVRVAVGGAFGYPVLLGEFDAASDAVRQAEAIVDAAGARLWDDMRTSAAYRRESLVFALGS